MMLTTPTARVPVQGGREPPGNADSYRTQRVPDVCGSNKVGIESVVNNESANTIRLWCSNPSKFKKNQQA